MSARQRRAADVEGTQRQPRSRWRDLGLKAVIALTALGLTLAGLELFLANNLSELSPLYPTDPLVDRYTPARWWTCDEVACHFDADHVGDFYEVVQSSRDDPSTNTFYERLTMLNAQGFHDQDDFVASAALEDSFNILVLGDSFAFGASADPGHSWVELLEADLQASHNVVIWNTGIPGVGTRQALSLLKHYYPIMQPDVVILAFFGNDFEDNLYPLDGLFWTGDGRAISRYVLDPDYVPLRLSTEEARYRATGGRPSSSAGPLERLAGRTRFGTLVLMALARREYAYAREADYRAGRWDVAVRETEALLGEVRDTVPESEASLLILHVPSREDLRSPGQEYVAATELMRELSLEVVDVREHLAETDYGPPPNAHWNNEGHAVVASLLSERLQPIIER